MTTAKGSVQPISQPINMDEVKGIECKHVFYTESNTDYVNDLLTIKEVVHYKDGRRVPNMRFIENYKRQFWVTKEGNRDHKDKKESELISKLQAFPTTQRGMLGNIAKALGRGPIQGGLRQAAMSPYLYGCDITTATLAKQRYMQQYPDCISDNDVALFDIEADVIAPANSPDYMKPIMASMTFGEKAVIAITRSFMKGIIGPEAVVHAKFIELVGEYAAMRNITLEVVMVDTIAEGIIAVFKRAHEWRPDFVSIWNINYDVPAIVDVLVKAGYDPADVFSDPGVPLKYRYFHYKEGPAVKITASGKSMTLSPAERWHVVTCPASFYFIDSMCVYQKIRIAKGKEPSYALDAILKTHAELNKKYPGIQKLKFAAAAHLHGLAWHRFMQTNYPAEYAVYCLFDCISVELLDEVTADLKRTISLLCGFSEYSKFPSQPRRTCDDLHFFYIENGRIAATTSRQMTDENDKLVIGLNDWISTLPSYLVEDNGLQVILECPHVHTELRAQVADLDVAGTYPTEEVIENISKETTKRELCSIEGISEKTRRVQGINLTGGHTNAVELCVELYGAPSFKRMFEAFEESMTA